MKMRSQKQQPIQECIDEDAKLLALEGMPRELDTFWRTDTQQPRCRVSGHSMFSKSALNKATAFSHRERQLLSIHGFMPAAVFTVEQQLEACAQHFPTRTTNFQKYIFLTELEAFNRKLFFNLLISDPGTYMSVFKSSEFEFSVKNFSILHTNIRGMYVTIKDRGHIYDVLRNWPRRHNVRYLVVTNGESVLSLGDYGVNAAPVVFYKLYQNVAYGGVDPDSCLPVMLDVGTDNDELLRDPLYLGLPQRRVTGDEYEAFFEEFTIAVLRLFGPRVIIQTKNFGAVDSIKQLERYRYQQCFMDINLQCLGACGLAGLLCANKISEVTFKSNKLLFYGNGTFNIGMARQCLAYLKRWRLDDSVARDRIWFCDAHGLIVHGRCDHKVPTELLEFKHRHQPVGSLLEAINLLKPNVLVGCSSEPNVFTKDIIRAMEQSAEQPIIYAMSTPLELAECSANDAFVYTKGRCIFISAAHLPSLKYANKVYQPGYCNVQYMLAGLTLGVMLSGMKSVPDETFLVAADRLASLVWPNDMAKRDVFPPMRKLKCINMQIAHAVFTYSYRRGLATLWPEPSNPKHYIESRMYNPNYVEVTQPIYCTTDHQIGTTESIQYYKQKI
ncbi:NADP-dependent malic enzyme [Drosophila montana]|uniref:NADP-dependent malic enzyme n=1 Tax=Drosophila montana TaxID=40370 RepID=UPI00313E8E71